MYCYLFLIFRLPEDVYQVAKVSKILQITEKGKADKFKNKSLDEIDIDMEEIIFLDPDGPRRYIS